MSLTHIERMRREIKSRRAEDVLPSEPSVRGVWPLERLKVPLSMYDTSASECSESVSASSLATNASSNYRCRIFREQKKTKKPMKSSSLLYTVMNPYRSSNLMSHDHAAALNPDVTNNWALFLDSPLGRTQPVPPHCH